MELPSKYDPYLLYIITGIYLAVLALLPWFTLPISIRYSMPWVFMGVLCYLLAGLTVLVIRPGAIDPDRP